MQVCTLGTEGPPIGIAPTRDLTRPAACAKVFVNNEKQTRFSRFWCFIRKNCEDVPTPALSSDLLLLLLLLDAPYYFLGVRRLWDGQLTDFNNSDMMDCGVTLLNCPEQSHRTNYRASPVRQTMDPWLGI